MEKAKLAFERRKHPRARLLLPLQYRLINKSSEVQQILAEHKNWDSARLKSLSQKGVQLVSKAFLKKQSILKLELELPSSSPQKMKVFAEVVWCRESGEDRGSYDVGINFLNLREDEEGILRTYVSNLLGKNEEEP